MRPLRLPEERPDNSIGRDGTIRSHPAFGVITIIKTSGDARLFGSDLQHSGYISIEVRTCDQHRSLSEDRNVQRERLMKFNLSEHQWAVMVASVGNGGGTPCTLDYYRGGDIVRCPGIAEPQLTRKELHGQEIEEAVKRHLAEAERCLAELNEMVNAAGTLSKPAVRERVATALRHVQQLPGSCAFVTDQFVEAAEAVEHEVKIEIEAHVNNLANKLGYQALREMAPRLEIQQKD